MKLFLPLLLIGNFCWAVSGPIYTHENSVEQKEWEHVYQELNSLLKGTVSNWASWTPTFTSFGTVTSVSSWWRRVGDTIEVRGTATAGTTSAAVASMSLPNGYTIDTSKAGSQASFGVFIGGSTTNPWWSNNYAAVPFYDGSDNTLVFFAKSNSGTSLVKQNANNIATAAEIMSWQFSFPATGLSF